MARAKRRSATWAEYQKYIKSAAWQRRKSEYFKVYFKSCVKCGSKSKSITLHHMTYERMGHEWDRDMVPLCGRCHVNVHLFHDEEKGTLLADSLKFLEGNRPKRKYQNYRPKPKRRSTPLGEYHRY